MSIINGPTYTYGDWTLQGTGQADTLYGGKGSNHLHGGDGDDVLIGGLRSSSLPSVNHFDGGAGEDTVVYGGRLAEYDVVFDAASGDYRIGQDTLHDVEVLQFGDVRLQVADAVAPGTRHHWTDGDDQLIGSDQGYLLQGGGGNDSFAGNGGDDTLYGGKGEDTAVYRGNRADYDIVYDELAQQYIVTDHQAGRDGQDRLSFIENLRFADTTIHFDGVDDVHTQLGEGDRSSIDDVKVAPPATETGSGGDAIPIAWIGFDDTGINAPDVGVIAAAPISAVVVLTGMADPIGEWAGTVASGVQAAY